MGLGSKGIPQTGQSRCPSRLRLSTLQGFSLVVMVKEVRASKREATSCSKSSRRESKSWRGDPICLGWPASIWLSILVSLMRPLVAVVFPLGDSVDWSCVGETRHLIAIDNKLPLKDISRIQLNPSVNMQEYQEKYCAIWLEPGNSPRFFKSSSSFEYIFSYVSSQLAYLSSYYRRCVHEDIAELFIHCV